MLLPIELPELPYKSPNGLGLYLYDLQMINPLRTFLPEWRTILKDPQRSVSLVIPSVFRAMLRTSTYLMEQMELINEDVNMFRHCISFGFTSGTDSTDLTRGGLAQTRTELQNHIGSNITNNPSGGVLPSLTDNYDRNVRDNNANSIRREAWHADLERRDQQLLTLPGAIDCIRILHLRFNNYLTEDGKVNLEKAQHIAQYILAWIHWNYYLVLHHMPQGPYYKECGKQFDKNLCYTELVTMEGLCDRMIRYQEARERRQEGENDREEDE